MADTTVDALTVDLLLWLAAKDRTYAEVLEAWRTSCPRLPVWEDANDRGLIRCVHVEGYELVRVTPAGVALLEVRGLSAAESSRASNPVAAS